MQRIDPSQLDDGLLRKPSFAARSLRRVRAVVRYALRRLHQFRAALTFAVLLAAVGLALFSPLLLDDLAFRAAYLLRPSQDAIIISEPIVVSEQPRLTVVSGTLSVPPALSGQARTADALAALLKGGSARLALKNPTIHLELSPQNADESDRYSDWTFPDPLAANSPLMNALEDASFETLTVRDGTIVLKSDGGRIDTLENVSADISVKRKTAVRIKGSFKLAGEKLIIDATLGARIGRGSSARMPLKAQVQSGLVNVTVDGRIELGQGLALIAPSADITIPNMRSVARWLGHAWPSGPGLKNFAARGNAEWSGQMIAFQKGTFEIDGNEGNGALTFSFGGTRPAIAGTLAFQHADLAAYIRMESATAVAPVPASPKSLIGVLKSTRDLTLPLLGVIDADLRASAETVTIANFKAGRSAASLALRNGQMLFNLADMVLPGGGSADGELTIQGVATTPNYTAHGRIYGVELSELTSVVGSTPMLHGKGDVQFDFKGGGQAGMDLLSRLNGEIFVEMERGGAASCSTTELIAMATAEGGDRCKTTTILAPFKAKASSTNGVLAFDQIVAMSGSNRMRFDGNVDLVTSVMHFNVTTISPPNSVSVLGEPPPDVEAAREVIAIRGRPDEVKISVRPK
ncbi:MAG: AsmA-like C-terminal region-containing protein [Hyphomicrobiaceae bacterium]